MMIDWTKVESMTPEEIENIRVEAIKELQTMENNHQIVKDEYLHYDKEIKLLEIKKMDARISMGKSSNSIKNKKSDIEVLQTKFWQSKR